MEMTPNADVLKGNWNQLKGKVKERWGKLTDQDLVTAEGNYDQLKGSLQKAYGYTKEKAETEFDDFIRTVKAKTADFSNSARHAGERIESMAPKTGDDPETPAGPPTIGRGGNLDS